MFSLETILGAAGGGTVSVLALVFWLSATGRLVKPDFYISEIEKRDKTIIDERAYSKQVVADLQEVNRSIRENVVPAMTTMNNQTVTITSLLQQDLVAIRSRSN